MSRRLLDFDPISRESVYFEMDDDGIATLHHHQDVGHILELNKMMSSDDDYTKRGMKQDWWHYARIPNNLIFKWLKEEGIDVFNKDHEKAVFKKLNSPEYRYLKVTTKKHA